MGERTSVFLDDRAYSSRARRPLISPRTTSTASDASPLIHPYPLDHSGLPSQGLLSHAIGILISVFTRESQRRSYWKLCASRNDSRNLFAIVAVLVKAMMI